MLSALDILGFGFTSLVFSTMFGDDGGVVCTAATTGNVAVTPLRPDELLLGLCGVGVADIIGYNRQRPADARGIRKLQSHGNDGRFKCAWVGACTLPEGGGNRSRWSLISGDSLRLDDTSDGSTGSVGR